MQQFSYLLFNNAIVNHLFCWIGCPVVTDIHVPVLIHAVVESMFNAVLCTRSGKIPSYISYIVFPVTVLDRIIIICLSRPQEKSAEVIQCEYSVFRAKTFGGSQPLVRGKF